MLKVLSGDLNLLNGVYIIIDLNILVVFEFIRGKKVIVFFRNLDFFKKMGVFYFWFSKVFGENIIDFFCFFVIFYKFVESVDRDMVVIVDGFEYLILENGFNSVIKFLIILKDNFLLKGVIFIVVVDLKVLELF